jgi:hypothetical protein
MEDAMSITIALPRTRSLIRPAALVALALPVLVGACVPQPGQPINSAVERARFGCSKEAQNDGYYVLGIQDVEPLRNDRFRVEMVVAKNNRQYDARCIWDDDDRDADLDVDR